ncbi:MAG: hypothetical protein A2144_02430 [Chloroflexi bacterium RBG_16_50_9]|nr:MAG: hypothetical protein A2144_02430 [Chloroflexi bacterium RBG_16_50_9]
MENKIINAILDNLFCILPIIHKKLLRMDLGGVTGNLSRLHMATMGMLGEGSLPVSEIARRLAIPKSQMTHLLNQLVNRGIVARQPYDGDRRVVSILLTSHSRKVLKERRRLVRQYIKNKLACLTPAELGNLSDALEKIKDIGLRLE